MFVIGTSLVVYPFAGLPDYTRPSVPRVVFNIDAVENFERPNDVYVPGDCDESIWSLCQKLGWEKDLWKLHNEIGGVGGDWELRGSGKKSPTESEETTVEEPGVEDAVAQLTRELEQELRLDKEEDVEIKKIEEKVDKLGQSLLMSETREMMMLLWRVRKMSRVARRRRRIFYQMIQKTLHRQIRRKNYDRK